MKIRTAILGYGRSGSTMHAGGVANNEAFEMVAACDIDAERREQAKERFGCAVYEDYEAMLREEELDLVCVITRSDQHSRMACECLEAGVNVLVTKPWALNEGEALAMMETAERTGKMLLPWLPARWGCDLKRLKELVVDEKAIGDVFLVRRAVCTFGTRNDWQTQRKHGGGYLLNWGPHIIDPPTLLMGGEVKSVYAFMKQTINPGDVEDVFMALLTMGNGAVVQAEFTIAVEELPSWFIQGTGGTIVVRGKEMKVCKNRPARPDDPTVTSDMMSQGEETFEETLDGDLYGETDEVYAAIAAAVRGDKPFPVKPADALQLTQLLDAIRLSDEEARVVPLP